jgi:hypothetical protein
MIKIKKIFNQMEALTYLVEVGPSPSWVNEWTEAAMYILLKKVIKAGDKQYTKEELDTLLNEVSDNY